MSKRPEPQSVSTLMRAKAAITPEAPAKGSAKKRTAKTSNTPDTPKTSDTSGKGGRPRKDRPEVRKYTVLLTPEQWRFLNVHAAGMDADRSAVLRALVEQLQAGKVGVP
jgi:hypothetical protein